ncbi:MAG: superoxide dismutase [Fe] [Proteobacteria bacterium]|nr:superoxide dismutase [Fe] [Pseudomonadota bacterium]
MSIALPEIPYNFADLEPVVSRDALLFHFLHHQRVCFDRMQPLIRGTHLQALSLEDLVRVSAGDPALRAVHRCAAEVWNHTIYWQSMHPRGGGSPRGPVAECLERRFGSYERFAHLFREAARAHFGSGWVWLVWRNGTVQIRTSANAGTPLAKADAVLLGLDLWEHAYYLDYQNRRAAYVSAFLEDLVNWDFANRELARFELAARANARAPAAATPVPVPLPFVPEARPEPLAAG